MWGEIAGSAALLVSVIAHWRINAIRRWMRDTEIQRQRDLLSIAERLEPDGPSSDGLPPAVSQKFRRRRFGHRDN